MKRILAAVLLSLLACFTAEASGVEEEMAVLMDVPYAHERLFGGANREVCRSFVLAGDGGACEKLSVLSNIRGSEYEDINLAVYRIRYDETLGVQEKVFRTAKVFADNIGRVSIGYAPNGMVFGWTQLADEDIARGIYYHDGLMLDCSGFVQYIYYIAAGLKVSKGTAVQCRNSVPAGEKSMGSVGYAFNPEAGGEEAGGMNHCCIWMGDHIMDCAAGEGLRYKDISGNAYWQDFMTYYAVLKEDEVYGDMQKPELSSKRQEGLVK